MGNWRLCALTLDGEYISAKKITFETGRPQKIRSLPNGDVVIEKERRSIVELDKPPGTYYRDILS